MTDTNPLHLIQQSAIRYLARRDYSKKELTQKLTQKGHEIVHVETVLTHLMTSGLLNDQRFTENYIHWRRNKGFGPKRIALELQLRGITQEMIAEELMIADNAWFIEIRRVWQKRFKGKKPVDFKDLAKQTRFLQTRGFTQQQIENLFSELKD